MNTYIFWGAMLNKNKTLFLLYGAQSTLYQYALSFFIKPRLSIWVSCWVERRVGVCWWTPLMTTDSCLVPDSAGGFGCSVCSHLSLSACRPTLTPTYLPHPVCVFYQCSRVDRTLLHHSAFLDTSLSLLFLTVFKYTLNDNLRGANLPQLQKRWGELVTNKTASVRVAVLSASC